MLSNCVTKIILSSSEKLDCEYFSGIMGSISIPASQTNISQGNNQNISSSATKNSESETDTQGT
ncbi:hypothetical protein HOH45_05475 [bacterium]|nr:hypothetical protein [bacterium]